MTVGLEQRRRKVALIRERRRSIILGEGPSHPEFGDAFMRLYLPHYCSSEGEWVPFAEWHHPFFHSVFGSLGSGEAHIHEAFRGGAKSTISNLGVILAALALQRKNYIWLVQDTAPQAKQSMESILAETEGNTQLAADFPHLVPAVGRHNRPVADRDDDVVFASGQRLQALGAGQKLRGRRHRQHRPDLAIVDDLENDEAVLTKYQRDKLDRWFSASLLGALAPGADLHLLGTPLHNDALIRRLSKRGGFKYHRFAAVKDTAGTLCPDCEDESGRRFNPDTEEACPTCFGAGRLYEPTWEFRDQEYLGTMRLRMGATAFARELLLIVTDEERKRFPRRWMKRGARPHPTQTMCRIAVDPAIGEKKENDRSAIVVGLRQRGSRRYHVDHAWADRVRGSKLRERIISTYEEYVELGYSPIVVFEKVQAQAWGAEALEEAGIPVKPVTPQTDKLTRAEPISQLYENGQVTHAEELDDSEFEDELDQFPDGELDDYVDADVYALGELQGDPGAGVSGSVSHARSARSKKREHVDPRAAD